MGVINKFLNSLKKTKQALSTNLGYLFQKNELDEDFYEELEFVLISSDISSDTVDFIINEIKSRTKLAKTKNALAAKNILKQILIEILEENKPIKINYPSVFLVVGVNGVGKTTTIGKLAKYFTDKKKSVVIAAGDTFRAAASDQLNIWAERAKVKIVKSAEGTDAGAVVFDAISSAKAKANDVLIIDTAGRLHNKVNLMEELKKISRIVEREYPEAIYHKIMVLDATTGQNAVNQVQYFNDAVGLTDIVVTKLDGTSKAGFLIGLSKEYQIPVRFVGVGEAIDDLIEFSAIDFVNSIIE